MLSWLWAKYMSSRIFLCSLDGILHGRLLFILHFLIEWSHYISIWSSWGVYSDIYTAGLILYQCNTSLSLKKCHEFAVWKCSHKWHTWLLPVRAGLVLRNAPHTLSNMLDCQCSKDVQLLAEQENNICGSGWVTFNSWQGLKWISHTCAYHSARLAVFSQPEHWCRHTGCSGGISIYIHAHTYTRIYMYVYMFVCIYVHYNIILY